MSVYNQVKFLEKSRYSEILLIALLCSFFPRVGFITIFLKSLTTKDILASLGANKKKQFLIGFALETNNEIENAIGKLKRKNLDFIVLNSLKDKGAGFGKSTNKITIIDMDDSLTSFELKSKKDVAIDIVNYLLKKI